MCPAALLCALALAHPTPQDIDASLLAGMRARSIGPAGMSGRVAAIDVVPSRPNEIWIGAATGGLWRSRNGGLSFEPLFEHEKVASIGAIAIDPNSPEVVWVGTGEGNPRNSASVGYGLWRTADGGATWTHLGLEKTERIHRIVLDPGDPDVAWVAAMGQAWGESEERGVYRTRDGGATWERVLFANPTTGCADLVADPRNPRKLFAALWDYHRDPWFFRSGGPGSGLWVTRDGGDSWERLDESDGLPAGELGRIGLAISRSHPEVVYALVEAQKSALLRSDDGGRSWRTVNDSENVAPRPFYFGDIRVDPADPDRVYNLHSTVTVSDDGGKSFRTLIPWSTIHPDHHALWIHPEDPRFLVDGNDGGVAISHDHGATWRFVRNLPLAQFYHVAVDMEEPYHVLGGMQDNGSWRGPSEVWENSGIRNHHWTEVGFGDGFDTLPDPDDPSRGYSMWQGGGLMRWNAVTGERKSIRPPAPVDEDGHEIELRFNWNAGLAVDPFDHEVVYLGSQFLHRSPDRGETWQIVSPDLTTDDPDKERQDESGGLTLDVTAAENHCSIVAIAPSPLEPGVVWVGTDDGRLQVTTDGGTSWTSVEANLPDVPADTWIPHVEPSSHVAGRAYVVCDDHRRSNWQPYVLVTEDYGASWSELANASLWGYALVVEEDPIDPNLLFLGTEFGLWVSVDRGASWFQWKHGLPTVAVRDLVVHPRESDLVIATHGRAAYVLDDVSPLRGLSASVLKEPLHLFGAGNAIEFRRRQVDGNRFPGEAVFRGQNPPYGAPITFSLFHEKLEHPDPEVAAEAAKERETARAEAPSEPGAEPQGGSEAPAEGGGEVAQAGGAGEEPQAEAGAGEPQAAAGGESAQAEAAESQAGEAEEGDQAAPKVEIEIRDAAGELVRTLEPDVKLGLNRVTWDLRRKAFRHPDFDAEKPQDEEEDRPGDLVPPGSYHVTVRFGQEEASTDLRVRPDPRVPYDPEARAAAYEAEARAGRMQEALAELADRLRAVRADLDTIDALIARSRRGQETPDGEEPPHADLADAVGKLREALKELSERIRPKSEKQGIAREQGFLSDLWEVSGSLGSSWDAPNATQLLLLERREAELAEIQAQAERILGDEVRRVRALYQASGLGLLSP